MTERQKDADRWFMVRRRAMQESARKARLALRQGRCDGCSKRRVVYAIPDDGTKLCAECRATVAPKRERPYWEIEEISGQRCIVYYTGSLDADGQHDYEVILREPTLAAMLNGLRGENNSSEQEGAGVSREE
jgi:hypothetical protein